MHLQLGHFQCRGRCWGNNRIGKVIYQRRINCCSDCLFDVDVSLSPTGLYIGGWGRRRGWSYILHDFGNYCKQQWYARGVQDGPREARRDIDALWSGGSCPMFNRQQFFVLSKGEQVNIHSLICWLGLRYLVYMELFSCFIWVDRRCSFVTTQNTTQPMSRVERPQRPIVLNALYHFTLDARLYDLLQRNLLSTNCLFLLF